MMFRTVQINTNKILLMKLYWGELKSSLKDLSVRGPHQWPDLVPRPHLSWFWHMWTKWRLSLAKFFSSFSPSFFSPYFLPSFLLSIVSFLPPLSSPTFLHVRTSCCPLSSTLLKAFPVSFFPVFTSSFLFSHLTPVFVPYLPVFWPFFLSCLPPFFWSSTFHLFFRVILSFFCLPSSSCLSFVSFLFGVLSSFYLFLFFPSSFHLSFSCLLLSFLFVLMSSPSFLSFVFNHLLFFSFLSCLQISFPSSPTFLLFCFPQVLSVSFLASVLPSSTSLLFFFSYLPPVLCLLLPFLPCPFIVSIHPPILRVLPSSPFLVSFYPSPISSFHPLCYSL